MRNPGRDFGVGLASALVALLAWCSVSFGDEVAASAEEWIGATVSPLSTAWRERWDYWRPGVLVSQVVPGGAADRAGIAPGDVIVLVGSVSLRSEDDLAVAKDRAEPGQPVPVTLARNNGHLIKITNLEPAAGLEATPRPTVEEGVAPSARVEKAGSDAVQPDAGAERWSRLGIVCAPLNADLASVLGVAAESGVLVLHVTSDGYAGRVGIRAGDVITSAGGKGVEGVSDVRGALERASSNLQVHVQRRDIERDVDVSLETPPTPGAEGPSLQSGQDERDATRQQLQALRREIEKLRAEVEALKQE